MPRPIQPLQVPMPQDVVDLYAHNAPGVVQGRPISLDQWVRFWDFVELRTKTTPPWSLEAIGKRWGVTRVAVGNIPSQEWFRHLSEAYLAGAQAEYSMALASGARDIAEGVLKVARGDEPDSRIASAQVLAGKHFAEIGKAPLVDRRPQVNVNQDNRTLNVVGAVTGIRELGKAAVRDFLATGVVPANLALPGQEPEGAVIENEG